MEYSVILSFLDYLRMLPNDNEYKRRALVNIFINAIYLYDGYFTMILNAGNRPLSIENIPLDDIEKTFENDDVGCSSNSQLVADAPPKIGKLRKKVADFYFFTIHYSLELGPFFGK